MTDYAYPHVAARLFDTALAIEPVRLKRILDAVGVRVVTGFKDDTGKTFGERKAEIMEKRLQAVVGGEMVDCGMGSYCRSRDGIAILSVLGPLAQRYDWLADLCGFATYDGIKETFNAALNDSRVKGILFDYDSPGGEAIGCFDLASYIHGKRDIKPIWSVAQGMACSAAYALAGAASKMYATSMSYVGSIGIVAVHADVTEQDKARGVKYTAIYSGKHKIDGWSHMPLSAEVKEKWGVDMDEARRVFAAVVGTQGRMDQKAALETEAEIYRDEDAVKNKLVDGIKSFDDVYDELVELVGRRPSSGAFAASREQPKHGAISMNVKDEKKAGDESVVEDKTTAVVTPPADNKASEQLAAAQAEATRVREIVDLCALAGMPEKSAGFVRDTKMTVDDVRAALLKAKSDKTDASRIDATAPVSNSREGNNGWDAVVENLNKQFSNSRTR